MNTCEQKKQNLVHAKNSKGFTLVELLVVIAVIGILLALLLPAVQSARESGRKTACMSNAYQLGMAVNRYDQDKGRVPGWQSQVGGNFTSWPVVLLPYIERNDIYDLWAGGTPQEVRVGLFVCPSAPPSETLDAPIAYAGNAGDGISKPDGVMPPYNQSYSLADVADGDGTATTLLFAERAGGPAQKEWSYPYPNGFQGSLGSDFPVFGHAIPVGSSHVGGVVVAFCDGHTNFLQNLSEFTQLVTSRNSGANNTAPLLTGQY